MQLEVCDGVYGKTAADRGLYFGHEIAASGTDANIDFNVADTGFIKNAGDTQVLSFNMAFPEDASNRAMTIRGYGWQSWTGAPYGMGWTAKYGFGSDVSASNKPSQGPGWVMKIFGDRMYLFGDDTFYSLTSALMPDTWNSFRLEMTKGQHAEGANELTYKAFVNDIFVAEGSVPYNQVWRGANATPDVREFFGFGRISFNYNWNVAADYAVAGGYYLDDINVTNYYGAAVPQRAASPLLTDASYTDAASTAATPSTLSGWNHDKWVTAKCLVYDVMGCVMKVLNDIGDLDGNNVFEQFKVFERIDRCKTVLSIQKELTDIFKKICENSMNESVEKMHRLIEGVKTFVGSYYDDPNLSCEVISDLLK